MRRAIGAVIAFLLAATAAAVWPGSVANAAYSDPLTAIATSKGALVWHATPAAALSGLDAALPNVGVATVLADGNRPMRTCNSTEASSLPIAPASNFSMCWESDDATDATWSPQGLTTTGDADDDGAYGADKAVLSGWDYSVTGDARFHDSRVAFINIDNQASANYRWVYLVNPNSTGTNFSAAKAHAGGMIWYGDKLFVSGVGNTSTAILVFSMSHILQINDSSATIGKTSSGYAAYGYKYVMPQIGYYTYSGGACSLSSDANVPCFSSISLDRTTSPDSLVTSEYFSDQTLYGRMFRYQLGTDYLLTQSGGNVSATEAYRSHVGNVQGVLSHNGSWYASHSSEPYAGQLWRQNTSQSVSLSCTNPYTSVNMCWSKHPEALTYNYATAMVWSQTEWTTAACANESETCGRTIFSVPLSAFP